MREPIESRLRLSCATPLLDVAAVAQAMGVTDRHIRRLVAERRIPFVKVDRFVRFDPGALDVWLDQQRVDVSRPPSVRGQFSVPAFGHQKSPPLGVSFRKSSGGETRTLNLAVNSRLLCH
jgi:excisionase family DNA binding protein